MKHRLSSRLMDGSLKFCNTEYRQHALEQFTGQVGFPGPRFLQIGLVRAPALWSLLKLSQRKKLKPKTAEDHGMMCALRAWSYLCAGHQWSQQAKCLKCQKIISDLDDVSIVTLALSPWDGKRRETKTAMASGFFCSACDVKDEEALAMWRLCLGDDGIRVGCSQQQGTA